MPDLNRRSMLQAVLAAATSLLPGRPAHAGRTMRSAEGMMGGGMGGMMGGGMMEPMRVGMELFRRHGDIRRRVTVEVAALIQKHVADMYDRIDRDRPFPYPMSETVPVMFQNIGRYRRQLELTPKGVAVTETAEDADMIKVIHAHAEEITGFVDNGMPAMMRGMTR